MSDPLTSHQGLHIALLQRPPGYVVIELKAGDFKPEDMGKLGFYLTAVDGQMKAPEDGPTVGLLLCKSKNRVVAEYALRTAVGFTRG